MAPKKHTIIWIDDEFKLMELHQEALKEAFPQYELLGYRLVDDGLRAIEKNRNTIAFVILDILMPFGNGFTRADKKEAQTDGSRTGFVVGHKIREINPEIPIVLLTVLRESEIPESLLSLVQGHIKKPVESPKLVEEIHELI